MPLTDNMPTTGKGVAAILMAVLAWIGSEMYRPLMPDGTDFGVFNYVNVGLGILSGWIVIGTRLNRSYSDGIGAGLTGVAALVFWAVMIQAFNEMLRLALERRYDGPVEALVNVFELALDFAVNLLHMPLLVLLIGGGVGIGIICEFVARRFS
ncbi:MAG: TrgA family protein [Pseudomonadota bacterium]